MVHLSSPTTPLPPVVLLQSSEVGRLSPRTRLSVHSEYDFSSEEEDVILHNPSSSSENGHRPFRLGKDLTFVDGKLASVDVNEDRLFRLHLEKLGTQDVPAAARYTSWVLLEENSIRVTWTLIITGLLAYIGTVFLFRLCFVDFRITLDAAPAEVDMSFFQVENAWDGFDFFVNAMFWIDLVIGFFYSFRDTSQKEVNDLKRCAKYYLKTTFFINLLACTPPQVVGPLWNAAMATTDQYPSELNSGLRVVRLQRMSRLARLVRVTRLLKLTSHGKKSMRWFERHKGARVINLFVGLIWSVHIFACGWYLCAALHDNPMENWVARRTVDTAGQISLLERGAVEQWLHAMYFVLTVFTTVGFGDISALTSGEMLYVCFLMVIGVIVHSLILSEVINVISSNDRINEFVNTTRDLVDAYADHTDLDEVAREELHSWIYMSAHHWLEEYYSKEDMRQLIVAKMMPRSLLRTVPAHLFHGKLMRNRLLTVCDGICKTPPRLPMLIALALVKCEFQRGDIIYEVQDYPFNLFLVLEGVFAYIIGRNSKSNRVSTVSNPIGGIRTTETEMTAGEDFMCVAPSLSSRSAMGMEPYMLFAHGNYFGEAEVLNGCPRRATTRCESRRGTLLAMQRGDFKELVLEFPEFAQQWTRRSLARERNRSRALKTMVWGRTYKELAALKIQWAIRSPYWKNFISNGGRRGARMRERADRTSVNTAKNNLLVAPGGIKVLTGKKNVGTDDLFSLEQNLSGKIDRLAGQLEAVVNHLGLGPTAQLPMSHFSTSAKTSMAESVDYATVDHEQARV